MVVICHTNSLYMKYFPCDTEEDFPKKFISLSADLRGEGLPWFFPSPDPTHVGASGTGSVLFLYMIRNS